MLFSILISCIIASFIKSRLQTYQEVATLLQVCNLKVHYILKYR